MEVYLGAATPTAGDHAPARILIAIELVGEVFYRSFANRRQLASFAGIAPSSSSGR
jgi:hypothetical protein